MSFYRQIEFFAISHTGLGIINGGGLRDTKSWLSGILSVHRPPPIERWLEEVAVNNASHMAWYGRIWTLDKLVAPSLKNLDTWEHFHWAAIPQCILHFCLEGTAERERERETCYP